MDNEQVVALYQSLRSRDQDLVQEAVIRTLTRTPPPDDLVRFARKLLRNLKRQQWRRRDREYEARALWAGTTPRTTPGNALAQAEAREVLEHVDPRLVMEGLGLGKLTRTQRCRARKTSLSDHANASNS